MIVQVHVRARPGLSILGQAVEHALASLGFGAATGVRVGKAIELSVDAESPAAAEAIARTMCERLLANPVTEDFVIEVGS
jgi:phosphoribosylformylglycinamidine synthase